MKKTLGLLSFITMSAFSGWAQNSTTIKVLDATVKDAVVSGAEVFIQKNGTKSVVGKTNAKGEILTDRNFDDDEQTLLIIKKPGYSTLVVKCPCQGYTYALSPSLKDNKSIRVVLSWGQQPEDLDIHMQSSIGHVYWGMQNAPGSNLDVDDRNGYGPETITISDRIGDPYAFWVFDYTNRARSSRRTDALSQSNAKVFVYRGDELIKTYYVPEHKIGNRWNVFSIDENDEITDYNEVVIDDAYYAEEASAAVAAVEENTYLRQGEQAYARKEYEAAVRLYTKALSQSTEADRPRIVNNMALAALRMGEYTKCIEASNKVLGYSYSSDQDKANAYYNAGMAYEKQGRYREAAQHFQKAANSVENNTVYINALKRVRKQIK